MSRCSRMCCEKSRRACATAEPRLVSTGGLRGERAPSVPGAHFSTVNPQVRERGRWAGRSTDEDQGPGDSASELWVPKYLRAVKTGWMAGEPQACLQALLFGGAPDAAQETQAPRIQSAERVQASGVETR